MIAVGVIFAVLTIMAAVFAVFLFASGIIDDSVPTILTALALAAFGVLFGFAAHFMGGWSG